MTRKTPELIQSPSHFYWLQSNYDIVHLEDTLKNDRILVSDFFFKVASFPIKKIAGLECMKSDKAREVCLNLIDRATTRNKNMLYTKFFLESLTSVISRLFTFNAVFVPCACLICLIKGAVRKEKGDKLTSILKYPLIAITVVIIRNIMSLLQLT